MGKREKIWSKNFITACIAHFLTACAFNLLMPAIPLYLFEELGVEASQMGIVLSSYAIALLFIRPFSGFLVDVYARKPLYIVGLSLFIAVFVGYYFAVTVTFLIILRFVHGLFWGLSTVSANTVAIDIIPESRRAEGVGYFGVNTNVAMAIAPFVAVHIYENHGFDFLISCALIMGVLAVIAVFFIRVPLREKLDKIPPMSFDRFLLRSGIPILWNQLMISFGWGTLIAFAILYGKETGVENPGVFFLFLAMGIILSRINSGRFVDKGFLHQVMVVALLAITLGFLCFALLHNLIAYCLSSFVIGIGYGTLFPALQTLYINMAPGNKRGTANATYLTGFDLGIGLGMLLGAVIADRYGFQGMYLMTSGLCGLGLVIYWLHSRKVYEKNRLV